MAQVYTPIEDEQLNMMNELTQLVEEKYAHLRQEVQIRKEDNVITMTIVCAEEPMEVDEAEFYVPKVDDICPEMLDEVRQNIAELYTPEEVNILKENLFTDKMPLELGVHLLCCAVAEDKAANANNEKELFNGRSLSLMLLAMYEMDCIAFRLRSDMTNLMKIIHGVWVQDDKHLLDYFYKNPTTARVRKKVDYYKFCISLWLAEVEQVR